MNRPLAFLFLVATCVGCSSTTNTSAASSDSAGNATSTVSPTLTPDQSADAGTADPSGYLDDLVERDWLVVEAPGTERDPTVAPAHLRFTYTGDSTGTLELSGCDSGTFPVTFDPTHALSVGDPVSMITCENPFDVGQAIPNILALPLRWSVLDGKLSVMPTTASDYSLVLTEDSRRSVWAQVNRRLRQICQ
jgi:hypothetical protein